MKFNTTQHHENSIIGWNGYSFDTKKPYGKLSFVKESPLSRMLQKKRTKNDTGGLVSANFGR